MTHSVDDGMIATPPSGPYSMQVTRADGSTGLVLIEVYLIR